jgi:hypothetical protein
MNADEMLDYVLGQIEPGRLSDTERELVDHPALSARVTALRDALQNRLADNGDDLKPPAGLRSRTLALVAESKRPKRRTFQDLVPSRVPFRLADFGVAAGIFVASLLTLLPQVQRTRLTANTASCAANLQQLGMALTRYAMQYDSYPYAPSDCSAPFAGTFALQLNDADLLPHSRLLDCPCNGDNQIPAELPSHPQLCSIKSPRSARCLHSMDYGYSLGVNHNGRIGPPPVHENDLIPILADRPPYLDSVQILSGNSPVHYGRGQNVLFTGGHVKWLHDRRSGPDRDIFLNAHNQPAPGVNSQDAVLGPGIARFDGKRD